MDDWIEAQARAQVRYDAVLKRLKDAEQRLRDAEQDVSNIQDEQCKFRVHDEIDQYALPDEFPDHVPDEDEIVNFMLHKNPDYAHHGVFPARFPDGVPMLATLEKKTTKWPLTPEEYSRYGRQMIVSSIGIQGQLRLKAASVLIVGAGGLGCPAAVYIAGAGVKRVGLVDGDTVELSNLHRQILHNTNTIGKWKVDSAIEYLKRFNPNVSYKGYREHLTLENAVRIVSDYDIVLDCTDHPKSRYLISDACVLLCKPLVSASALKTDGQQINLNYPPRPPGDPTGGPCYRCVFPKPPPADQLVSCGEGGIVGPVVGMMGVLQASEAIKLIVAGVSVEDTTKSEFEMGEGLPPPSMLIFAANSSAPFRTIRLRSRRPDCFACSAKAGLTRESLTSGSLDYVAFCGEVTPVNLLGPDERVAAEEFARLQKKGKQDCLLLDVREKVQFDIAHLDGSVNVPFSDFQGGMSGRLSKDMGDEWLPPSLSPDAPIYVVCRLGNDSQVVVKKLKEKGYDNGGKRYIGDIRGGLRAWREHVDGSWPDY